MKIKTMNKLTAHYDMYFGQSTDTVIHPVVDMGLHVDKLMKIGPQAFSQYLYPDEKNEKPHFLSEMHRSQRF